MLCNADRREVGEERKRKEEEGEEREREEEETLEEGGGKCLSSMSEQHLIINLSPLNP